MSHVFTKQFKSPLAYLAAFLVIVFLSALVGVYSYVQAGASDNVSGWAWSENIGWISFNCTNDHNEMVAGVQTCIDMGGTDYGVNVDPSTGNFSGYAWSEHIGWISFNRIDTGTPPDLPYNGAESFIAKLDVATNEVRGWARALAFGGGWDGWIKLRDAGPPPYGVSYDPATAEFHGWAWGSDVVGWVSLNCAEGGPAGENVCATSSYKATTSPDLFNAPPTTPSGTLVVTTANSTDYCGITAYPPVRVNWEFNDPGDTQSAFQIQVFQGVTLVVDTGKKLGSSQSYVFQLTGEQLLWGTAYSWQVKVWDSKDVSSTFTPGPSFSTAAHHFPVANFTFLPSSPGIGEQVQFQDQTLFGPGSFSKTWAWDFENDTIFDSFLQNPTHAYLTPGSYDVLLKSLDDVGSCTTLEAGNPKSINIGVSLPEWQEISPF